MTMAERTHERATPGEARQLADSVERHPGGTAAGYTAWVLRDLADQLDGRDAAHPPEPPPPRVGSLWRVHADGEQAGMMIVVVGADDSTACGWVATVPLGGGSGSDRYVEQPADLRARAEELVTAMDLHRAMNPPAPPPPSSPQESPRSSTCGEPEAPVGWTPGCGRLPTLEEYGAAWQHVLSMAVDSMAHDVRTSAGEDWKAKTVEYPLTPPYGESGNKASSESSSNPTRPDAPPQEMAAGPDLGPVIGVPHPVRVPVFSDPDLPTYSPTEGPPRPCDACDGRGGSRYHDWRCTTCRGRGWCGRRAAAEGKSTPCDECRGVGLSPHASESLCEFCGGSGRTP